MLLKIEDLHTNYGAIHALKGISLEVNEGEIVCLIGSNGAGKTTVFNLLTGVYKPDSACKLYRRHRKIEQRYDYI
mgnify:CR=1 FL=1